MQVLKAGFGFLGLFSHLFSAHTGVTHERIRYGRWSIEFVQDSFAGHLACSAKYGRLRYSNGIVFFALNPGTDTTNALYRLNDGPPHSWREHMLALEKRGYAPERDTNLDASSRELALPFSTVKAASVVLVRGSDTSPIQKFRLEGLDSVVAELRMRGCAGTMEQGPDAS